MDENRILINMGECAVTHNPHVLSILGLGSCVGVAMYAKAFHFGGLVHIMLPDSTEFKDSAERPFKYADTGIPEMLKKLLKMDNNMKTTDIVAKMAGGAHMFPSMNTPSTLDIGKKNVEMSKKMLKSLGIRLVADDVGGNHGRTVNLDLSTGVYSVHSPLKGVIEI